MCIRDRLNDILADATTALQPPYISGRRLKICLLYTSTQMAADNFRVEFRFLKHGIIRQKGHARTMLARRADAFQRRDCSAGGDFLLCRIVVAFKPHAVMPAAGAAIHNKPFAQRVDDRSAHAMQTAGIGIILMVELAARMQLGIDDLYARNAKLRMNIHRHAAAVILHGGAAVLMPVSYTHLDVYKRQLPPS